MKKDYYEHPVRCPKCRERTHFLTVMPSEGVLDAGTIDYLSCVDESMCDSCYEKSDYYNTWNSPEGFKEGAD